MYTSYIPLMEDTSYLYNYSYIQDFEEKLGSRQLNIFS